MSPFVEMIMHNLILIVTARRVMYHFGASAFYTVVH